MPLSGNSSRQANRREKVYHVNLYHNTQDIILPLKTFPEDSYGIKASVFLIKDNLYTLLKVNSYCHKKEAKTFILWLTSLLAGEGCAVIPVFQAASHSLWAVSPALVMSEYPNESCQ